MRDWRRFTPLVLALVGLAAELAEARPGGGQSYSGGSSSGGGGGGSYGGGGSGGGGGGGELLELVFRLLWYLIASNPRVGIPVLLVLIGVGLLVYWGSRRGSGPSWSTGSFGGQPIAPAGFAPGPTPSERLLALRAVDPDFSLVLFEDFAYALFAEAHTARGAGKLAELSAYLTPAARAGVAATSPPPITAVRSIIVGAMGLEEVRDDGQTVSATVRFEANWTEVDGEGQEHGCYTVSVWRFSRARTARSRPPDKTRVFACPNCAAPLGQVDKGVCASCGTRVDTGFFDWVVVSAVAEVREDRGVQIGGDVPEQGTALPTRIDRRVSQRLADLGRRDPGFTLERFNARVKTIFAELQAGWSSRDWTRVRPYLSDRLFQTQLGWIEEYTRQQLRNVTENARVTNLETAKVTSDRWYDAITVRLFATGLDYTVTDAGKLRSGSRSRERSYSEYWTLIRGTTRPEGAPPPADDKKCPNCGAELKVNMAGTCEYCNARVAAGDFDWVLSRIEQDDSYQG